VRLEELALLVPLELLALQVLPEPQETLVHLVLLVQVVKQEVQVLLALMDILARRVRLSSSLFFIP
jgi:hypothetical protein